MPKYAETLLSAVAMIIVAAIMAGIINYIKFVFTIKPRLKSLEQKSCELQKCNDDEIAKQRVMIYVLSAIFDKVFYDKTNGKKAQAEIELNKLIYQYEAQRAETI